ncbi:hypothetical protein BDZ88DRAFT_441694 [Geranomyces variabilis]|nr:hypothetical protein BDZ88DRAFT_441694 [Geranomyces variabilis]
MFFTNNPLFQVKDSRGNLFQNYAAFGNDQPDSRARREDTPFWMKSRRNVFVKHLPATTRALAKTASHIISRNNTINGSWLQPMSWKRAVNVGAFAIEKYRKKTHRKTTLLPICAANACLSRFRVSAKMVATESPDRFSLISHLRLAGAFKAGCSVPEPVDQIIDCERFETQDSTTDDTRDRRRPNWSSVGGSCGHPVPVVLGQD